MSGAGLLAGIVVLTLVLSLTLKKDAPVIAFLLVLAAGVVLLLRLGEAAQSTMQRFSALLARGNLGAELLDFAGREGILSGPIFITRRGTPVGRTTVTALIQSLAHDAQVEAGKCTPRCLRKLYLQTQERILHNISTLAREEYEKLLRSEQEKTGWNA